MSRSPADYDGDTKADIAIFRPSINTWFMRSSTGGPDSSLVWGATNDVPEPADYDGDTKADIAVYRPSNGNWYRKASAAATFAHDSRGNRTRTTRTDTNTAWNYGYDQANRMTTAPGAIYTYRGDGLRMAKNAGIATTFAWDESGSMPMVLAEKTSSGTTRYIYGPTGSPIARIDGDGKLYYHHDQLGSIRAITNQTGDTVGTATYDPYGTRTHHSGITTPFGFAGQYTDTETGFQYLRNRYYDPTTATFLTRDPIEAITQEPYGYVGGNPTNWTDPTGLGCGLFSPGDCVDSVVEAVQDTTEFVVRNRGTIATIAAAGTCLIPAVGVVGCGVAAAAAFGVRAEQRVDEHGFSNSLGANLTDGALTSLTLGLAGAFESLAGPWAGVAGAGALKKSGGLSYLGRLIPAGYDVTNLFSWLDEQC